ncbi:MAG: DNA recombination protein RmuC [Hyphomicrobiales bacterium]
MARRVNVSKARIGLYSCVMDFSQTFITIGQWTVSLGDAVLMAIVMAFGLLVLIAVLVARGASARKALSHEEMRRTVELEVKLAEMAGQLRAFHDQAAGREVQLAEAVNQRLDQVSMRLGQGLNENSQKTAEQLTQLHARLAVIDSAQKNLTELSSQVVSLQDILANKQTRGAFGEAQMEAIIRDRLPKSAYEFQTTLSNGSKPDCVVKLPDTDTSIAIDAKFPLEAFHLFRDAQNPHEVKEASARLRKDVGYHIKSISEKYLIPGETQETALMFVPSESVYADLHEHFDDLIQKAYRARVMVVSPTMLMLVVQTLQTLFKDAQMREQAGLIQTEVATMLDDVGRLHERVLKLQRHFGLASKDIEQIIVSSDKVTRRGLKIGQLELEDEIEGGEEAGPKLVAG